MKMTSPDMQAIREQVSNALVEDLGGELNAANDITANLIDESVNAKATIITREPCVVCGIAWANQAFALIDESVSLTWHVEDGDKVEADTVLVSLEGSARAILTAERTALNFLQTLSATATVTAFYAKFLAGSNTKILDTRKTLPGLRYAQKYAVRCGGGQNHRVGLFDAFLIKENHIFSCGNIEKAVSRAKSMMPGKPVEVEVENLEELEQALSAGADIVTNISTHGRTRPADIYWLQRNLRTADPNAPIWFTRAPRRRANGSRGRIWGSRRACLRRPSPRLCDP